VARDASGNVAIGATVHSAATSEPACDASHRGWIVRVEGGAGVADTYRQCVKSAADTYAWAAFGGGDVSATTCTKYTISETDLTAAATTQTIDLVSVAAGTKVTGLTIKEGAQFSGGGVTALSVSIGNKTGTVTEYAPIYSLMAVPGDAQYYDAQVYGSATWAAHTISAKFTSTTADVSALTQGSVDIWLCKVVLP
jgi:hypothetical protein